MSTVDQALPLLQPAGVTGTSRLLQAPVAGLFSCTAERPLRAMENICILCKLQPVVQPEHKMVFSDGNDEIEVSQAEIAAGMVEGTAKTDYMGETKVISVRIPASMIVLVQAMAQKMGKTRNAAVAMLLEVGLEEVRKRLSDETVQELHEIEQELFRDLYNLNGEA
ncbi:hypothetical protein [Comamonas aquatica]|uniref:hypothetical protein n=1 Tax=Comamonas aquatica TaxID=225991 RepID=UPI002447E5DC|nr:hypothetical protein [Comamonas aquatica]MDH0383725.1 hypothetical protein [Comamonas aquatica]